MLKLRHYICKVEYIKRSIFLVSLLSQIIELDFVMERLLALLSITYHNSQTPALKLPFPFIAHRRNNLLFWDAEDSYYIMGKTALKIKTKVIFLKHFEILLQTLIWVLWKVGIIKWLKVLFFAGLYGNMFNFLDAISK